MARRKTVSKRRALVRRKRWLPWVGGIAAGLVGGPLLALAVGMATWPPPNRRRHRRATLGKQNPIDVTWYRDN